MHPKGRALLYDVQQSGILLERFLNGKGFDDYVADPLLRSAVERQLEIMCEALNQLLRIDPANVARVSDYRRSSPCATSWFTATPESTIG